MADIFNGYTGPQTNGIGFIPESSHELDYQLFKIDKTIFSNEKIAKILTDDAVRSYLSEQWILALYYYASAYVGLVNAGQGEYKDAFDNAAELILADIMFLVNIARSRKGANIATVKGRGINKELFPDENQNRWYDNPPIPKQQQNQPPMNEQFYTNDVRR